MIGVSIAGVKNLCYDLYVRMFKKKGLGFHTELCPAPQPSDHHWVIYTGSSKSQINTLTFSKIPSLLPLQLIISRSYNSILADHH